MDKPEDRSDGISAAPTRVFPARRRASARQGCGVGRSAGTDISRDLDAFSRALVESLVERWIDRSAAGGDGARRLDGVRVDDACAKTLYRAIAVTERRIDAARFGGASYLPSVDEPGGGDGGEFPTDAGRKDR